MKKPKFTKEKLFFILTNLNEMIVDNQYILFPNFVCYLAPEEKGKYSISIEYYGNYEMETCCGEFNTIDELNYFIEKNWDKYNLGGK